MADPKKNPLIGAFRTPMPKESPPGKAEEKKPPEPAKVETKGAGAAAPGKTDEKKPPEPPKGEAKGAGAAAPGKTGEKKPPEPPEGKAKGTGAAAPGKAEEKKPPEPPKVETKGAGAAAPGKTDEKKPPEQPKDPNLRYVKLSDIQPLPGTYVKDTPREDYSGLIASIKESGLEKPVILRQSEKGGYQLVDGFHRCEALKRAGMLEVRADVYDMTIFDASRYRKG